MKDTQTIRFFLIALVLVSWPSIIFTAEIQRGENENQERRQDSTDGEEFYEQFYEWSIWSPCSRTCGIGIKFKGQLCLRENKALCETKPRIYGTCNTQACPQGSKNFRDVQCGQYNGRDIFINGERATWGSYVRGDNQCLLFCYPYGEDLFYYFGRARDGTQCSKEPNGVCVFGRCKPVGCDNKLESGIYLDKCRVCGGNSTTCQPIRGRVERSPTQFERLTGYAELMVIPKGSTSVFLTDTTWNYLALKRQNGAYIVNGNRIVNWSGIFKVGDVEVQYKRLSNNIGETIQIFGPTSEDFFVMSLLITGKLNTTFEYWKPVRVGKINEDSPEAGVFLQVNSSPLEMGWGSWTACSASCGGGIKVRARYPSIKSFREKDTEVKKCNVKPCDKMDASWSEWGLWDDCSVTCGGGARIRFRYCKKHGVSTRSGCPGERYEVELCNVETCPEEGTSLKSSEIDGRSTIASSQALQTEESVTRFIGLTPNTASSPNIRSMRGTFSESFKMPGTVSTHTKTPNIPSASHLSSLSYSSQHPAITAGSSSAGVGLKTFSRVEEHHSSSATLNVIRSSELELLESSTKQAIPSFGTHVSTGTQKEIASLHSKSQGVDVLQQKLSESSSIEKFSSSVSLVTPSTVTSAELLSTTSIAPGFVFSGNKITRNTVRIFPTIMPSPVSTEDWFSTTRQFKLSTYSIQSASSRISGAGIPSVSVNTVSIYGSKRRFSDKKPVPTSSRKDEAFDDFSLTPVTSHSTFQLWNQTADKSFDPRETLSLGPESSIFENSVTETFSSSLMVLSAIDYFKTPEVISNTKSRTTERSKETDNLRILVSSVLTTGMSSKYSPSRLKGPPSLSILRTSKPPSTSFVDQKRTSLPSSRDIKSSAATEVGFLRFTTSASQLPSLALEEETIIRPVYSLKHLTSRPQVQSLRSTMNTSKLVLRSQATQSTSSLFPFVTRRGYVYFRTSSYLQTRSPLRKEDMTRVSSCQSTRSVTLITETSNLSTTHLPTDFKQLKSSIDTEGGRLFLPTETSRPESTVEEETITSPLHSLTSLTPTPIMPSSMSTSRTLKPPFSSVFGEINSSLSFSSSVKSSVVTLARFVDLSTSSISEFSLSGEVMTSHRYSLSRERMFSSLSALQASKRQETPFASLPSWQHPGNAVFPQLSSPLEEKVTASPINSRTSLPSRQHLMEKSTVISRLGSLQSSSSSPFISSMRPSSALQELSTTSYLESPASLLSRQQILLPVNLLVTSILNIESRTGVVKLSRSLPSLQVKSALGSFMDSLRPFPSRQEMASLSSTQFSAAPRIQFTGSIMGPATITSLKDDMPSLSAPKASLTPKEELKTGLMSSFTTSSSKIEIPSSPSPQFSSTHNSEFTKSLTDTVKTSLSRHEMQSLQPPKAISTSKVANKIGFMNSSRASSSKHEMQSLGSSHLSSTSKLEVTKSHTDSIRTSISKHDMQSLLPQKASSTPKLEVTSSLIDTKRPSLSKHEMQSLQFLKASYTLKLKVTASLMSSMRTLLLKHEMQPLLPPKASSTTKLEVPTSLIYSMRPSLSKHEMQSLLPPKAISISKVADKIGFMNSSRTSPSKHEMQSLGSSHLNSTSKVEITTSHTDSIRTFISKHEMQPLLPQKACPTPKLEVTSSLIDEMRPSFSKHEMQSLQWLKTSYTPKLDLNSTTKLEVTSSLIDEMRPSFSKHEMQSLQWLKASYTPKLTVTASLMGSMRRASISKHELQPLLPPKASLTPILEVKTSLIDSMRPSLSKHEMQSLQHPKAISISQVADKIGFMNSSRTSSSKHEMQSLASSHLSSTSKVEVTTSHTDSVRPFTSKHEMQPLLPQKASSTPKREVTSSLKDEMRPSFSKHEMQSLQRLKASYTPELTVTASLMGSMRRASLSKHESSTSKVEVTTSHTDSVRPFISKHEMQPLLPQKAISTPKLEITSSLIDEMRPSFSKHEIQSLQRLKASYTPKLTVTASLMGSMRRASLSKHESSTSKVEVTTSHTDSVRPFISKHEVQPLLPQKASSTPKLEITSSLIDEMRPSFSRHEMQSLQWLKASYTPKLTVTASLMGSMRRASISKHELPPLLPSKASSTPKLEVPTSLIDSMRPSLSKHEMQSLLPPKAISISQVADKIGFMNSSRTSSSKHEMQSLASSHLSTTSKLEVTTSHTDSIRTSISRHEMQPLLPQKASSTPKLEVTSSLIDEMRPPSFSKHEMQSPQSLRASYTPKLTVTVSSMDSMRTSLLKHEMQPLLPPKASLTPKLKLEVTTSPIDSMRSSLSKHEMQSLLSLKASSTPKVKVTASLMASMRTSLSKHEVQQLLPPKASSTTKREVPTSLIYLMRPSLSKHEMQSLLSLKGSSTPKVKVTASLMASMRTSLSKHEMQPLLPPKAVSTPKLKVTTSPIDSMRSSLSKHEMQSLMSLKASSTPKLKVTVSLMDSMRTSLSKHEMQPLLSPEVSSTSKLEVPTSLMDSIIASSKHEMPLVSSPLVKTVLTARVELSTTVMVALTTSSSMEQTPSLESPQRFLISSSSLCGSVLQERSLAVESVSYERRLTNSFKEGDSSLILVSKEQRHEIVTATVDASSIPSSAIKTHVLEMVLSSPEPASVKVVGTPTPTAVQEEKSTECPPCDLSQRLKEKYCYSDYAILVRIRSEAFVIENHTSYAAKVRKVFKTSKPIKKKPEIRFDDGICNCRTDLSMKEVYIVFGKHVPWTDGAIAFLKINRDSFVTEWDASLQKEIDHLEGHCSQLNSMTPYTPRMSSTVTNSSGLPVHSVNKATTIALPSTRSDIQVETPSSRDWTEASTTEPPSITSAVEEKCGPCEIAVKRTRAYCTSDFVIHVEILSEAINEFNHDANYRVRLIHTFKLTSGVTTVRSVWILGNQCHCPLLLPGKQYLLMGHLGMRAGSSEPRAEMNRQSYVEVWKASMIRRLPTLKKRCPSETTASSRLVTETRGFTTAAVPSTTGPRASTETISSHLPTTQPASTPPVKCRRPCRITKKRNKSYCESDFVIRARILQSSFNDTLRERKYWVRIIKVYRSIVDLQVRENIFVVNDDCQCPKLELRKQYVIMGTVETFSITGIRLVIPPRPFVWMWKARMETGLQSVTCGN